MAENGIGDDTIVVAYDAGTIPFAARIVWMLRYYGHDEAYVLAGGLPAWTTAGHPTSTDVPAIVPTTFTPRAHPSIRATREEVLAIAEGRSATQLLETQRDQTYAQRDKDIAGAVRLSGNLLLEDERGGRIADEAKLQKLVRDAGLDPHKRTVVSCGSGVSASGAWLALREAGFDDVSVYDGSWLEWEHDALPTVPKPLSP
jgi:thiosulfate/3-mercaptopyruvate sulfurtransferase